MYSNKDINQYSNAIVNQIYQCNAFQIARGTSKLIEEQKYNPSVIQNVQFHTKYVMPRIEIDADGNIKKTLLDINNYSDRGDGQYNTRIEASCRDNPLVYEIRGSKIIKNGELIDDNMTYVKENAISYKSKSGYENKLYCTHTTLNESLNLLQYKMPLTFALVQNDVSSLASNIAINALYENNKRLYVYGHRGHSLIGDTMNGFTIDTKGGTDREQIKNGEKRYEGVKKLLNCPYNEIANSGKTYPRTLGADLEGVLNQFHLVGTAALPDPNGILKNRVQWVEYVKSTGKVKGCVFDKEGTIVNASGDLRHTGTINKPMRRYMIEIKGNDTIGMYHHLIDNPFDTTTCSYMSDDRKLINPGGNNKECMQLYPIYRLLDGKKSTIISNEVAIEPGKRLFQVIIPSSTANAHTLSGVVRNMVKAQPSNTIYQKMLDSDTYKPVENNKVMPELSKYITCRNINNVSKVRFYDRWFYTTSIISSDTENEIKYDKIGNENVDIDTRLEIVRNRIKRLFKAKIALGLCNQIHNEDFYETRAKQEILLTDIYKMNLKYQNEQQDEQYDDDDDDDDNDVDEKKGILIFDQAYVTKFYVTNESMTCKSVANDLASNHINRSMLTDIIDQDVPFEIAVQDLGLIYPSDYHLESGTKIEPKITIDNYYQYVFPKNNYKIYYYKLPKYNSIPKLINDDDNDENDNKKRKRRKRKSSEQEINIEENRIKVRKQQLFKINDDVVYKQSHPLLPLLSQNKSKEEQKKQEKEDERR